MIAVIEDVQRFVPVSSALGRATRIAHPMPSDNRIRVARWKERMPLPEFTQFVEEAKSQIKEIGPADLKKLQHAGEDSA